MIFKTFTLLLLLILATPALAQDDLRALLKELSTQVGELKQQVKQSNARISDLEKKLAQAEEDKRRTLSSVPVPPVTTGTSAATAVPVMGQAAAKPAVIVGDTKGTFRIPGTDTSLGFGGFAKFDAIYNSVGAGPNRLGNQALVPAQIPVAGQQRDEHSQIVFNPKESRFWLKSFTPSAWGDITSYLELDFFGSTDTYSYTPRLRHAYGSIGHLLAGQTWTTFLNVAAIADTLDIGGPVGSVLYLRQPLVRWTQPFSLAGANLEFQAAAESPRSRVAATPALQETPDTYGFIYPDEDRYPDLVARLNYNPDWGTLSLSGMGRHIRSTQPNSERIQEAWGGAVSLAGRINVYGLDNIRFMANYGDAYGRYAQTGSFEDASLDSLGRLRLVDSYGAMLAYQHWWSNAWRSSLVYGFEQADQPVFVDGGLTRQAQSLHGNLLWSPVRQVTIGLEYIYATRELVNGHTGALNRVQFSTRFDF